MRTRVSHLEAFLRCLKSMQYFVTLISGLQHTPTSVMFCGLSSDLNPQATPSHHGLPFSLSFLPLFSEELAFVHYFQLHELSYHISVITMMLQFWDQKQLLFFLLVAQALHMCTCACTDLLSPEPSTLQKLQHIVTHKSFCKDQIYSRLVYLTSAVTAKCFYCADIPGTIF